MIGVALIMCTLLIYKCIYLALLTSFIKIKDNSMVTILQASPEICPYTKLA